MFVCVARLNLSIPESSSLKAKRQVLRRVIDRLKARFNIAVAEVDSNDLWQKATIGMAVVGNERSQVNERMDTIIHSVEKMYVAPLLSRETEILSFGDQLFSEEDDPLAIPRGHRSLAEAEGMGDWEDRHDSKGSLLRTSSSGRQPKKLSLEEARARARQLRNRREWENK